MFFLLGFKLITWTLVIKGVWFGDLNNSILTVEPANLLVKGLTTVAEDVILFIASQIKSNIRELEGTLLRVTSFIKFTNTPFTLDAVKTILKDIVVPEENVQITIDKIQKVVAEEYNLTVKDLKVKKRTNQLAMPRQIAMYLARSLTDMSTTEIGDTFGGRDHTTVMHAYNKIAKKVNDDAWFAAEINKIIKLIKEKEDN